ncbi:MAG TPA: hypothetical protein VKX96_17150, partial [Chloroflexota bacterium]|nr:hypothetical protein [Chloroflexota bacterium]
MIAPVRTVVAVERPVWPSVASFANSLSRLSYAAPHWTQIRKGLGWYQSAIESSLALALIFPSA